MEIDPVRESTVRNVFAAEDAKQRVRQVQSPAVYEKKARFLQKQIKPRQSLALAIFYFRKLLTFSFVTFW